MVDAQSNFRVNDRKRYRSRGFGTPSVSVGLTHAHVARATKTPAKVAKPKPAKPVAPIAKPPSPVGRLLATYDDLVDVCRARADELQISRIELDRLTGLADAHSSMLLARKYMKVFGPVSTGLMLDALGLRLLVVEDPKLTARTLKRRTPRHLQHVRYPRQLAAPTAQKPVP
jgi:hypothetical protein